MNSSMTGTPVAHLYYFIFLNKVKQFQLSVDYLPYFYVRVGLSIYSLNERGFQLFHSVIVILQTGIFAVIF